MGRKAAGMVVGIVAEPTQEMAERLDVALAAYFLAGFPQKNLQLRIGTRLALKLIDSGLLSVVFRGQKFGSER